MSVRDWFGGKSGAVSWRGKANEAAARRDETAAAIERLHAEAAALLDGGAGGETAARRLAEIEAEVGTLTARLSLQQRAAADLEAKAGAAASAAEAERQRREAEAARKRRAEAEAGYLEQAAEVERAVKALVASFHELAARGRVLAEIDGRDLARRFFDPAETAGRFANTSWKHLAIAGTPARPISLFPFDPGPYQGARREFRETEANVVAALHDRETPVPPEPAPAGRSPRPLLAPDAPEAA